MDVVYDGAASHIKQAINRSMRDEQKAIQTSEQVISVISKLQNHEATMATTTSTDLSANTLHEIKKYHKFTTNKNKNIIYVYLDSVQTEYSHRYLPRNIVSLKNILIK